MQGRITCCNVLSDLYAMGVTDADTMLMLLAISSDMSQEVKDVVTTGACTDSQSASQPVQMMHLSQRH